MRGRTFSLRLANFNRSHRRAGATEMLAELKKAKLEAQRQDLPKKPPLPARGLPGSERVTPGPLYLENAAAKRPLSGTQTGEAEQHSA